MFTGIIEQTGIIEEIVRENGNLQLTIAAPFANELKIDQSVSHNGVCLTVIDLSDKNYKVTVIRESLDKTNFRQLKRGDLINLERSMKLNDRFDGHIVQGHVDGTASCTSVEEQDGSWLFSFKMEGHREGLIVEKGSVCINGVSLTVVSEKNNDFSVAIIPYTFEHTNFRHLEKGSLVNIEFDVIGKYVAKLVS